MPSSKLQISKLMRQGFSAEAPSVSLLFQFVCLFLPCLFVVVCSLSSVVCSLFVCCLFVVCSLFVRCCSLCVRCLFVVCLSRKNNQEDHTRTKTQTNTERSNNTSNKTAKGIDIA